jgi:hypothetical protein
MNYNLILYIGLAFYALIFITFIVYQMHDRKLDKKQWLSDQLTKSFKKEKLIPMTEEEEYRTAGITKKEINENNS